MLEKYMGDDGTNFVLNAEYMEIYIPIRYFESRSATQLGDKIRTLGLVNATVFDKNRKPIKTELFNLPTMIYLYPSDIEERAMQIVPGEFGSVEKYMVCKFFNGDPIMPNTIEQSSDNVEMLIQTLLAGKLDPSIPYDQLLNVIETCMELNNVGLNVPSTTIGVVIEGIYRAAQDRSKTYGKVAGKNPSLSPYAYKTAGIREICSRNSTFSALTFEDFDLMLTSSLNMNNYNKKQVESPFESIIKM